MKQLMESSNMYVWVTKINKAKINKKNQEKCEDFSVIRGKNHFAIP
jgi:CRISPR/Cas system Type II protein with McrA/HNH and RuvC-like nuclease domain